MENCEKNDHNDCLTCVRRSAMFNILSTEELLMIRKNRINIHYRAGEVIQKQGTFMSHTISVNSGLVKLYLEDESHNNSILRIVPPTNFIGGPGLYFDQLHHFTVSAMKDTSICFIDIQVFKSILRQNSAFANEYMKDFSKNVVSVYNRLISLTKKNLPGRLAYALLYLYEEVYENKLNRISISKQDLADLSAISRDSMLKTIRDFQQADIIKYLNNEIEILKPEMLRIYRSKG